MTRMIQILFKLILCVLLAIAAAFAYVAVKSGDPLYAFYEWMSPARFHQYDRLIRSVAVEHHLDPMLVNAGASRAQRWSGGNGVAEIPEYQFLQKIDFPATRRYVESIIDRYKFYRRRGRM